MAFWIFLETIACKKCCHRDSAFHFFLCTPKSLRFYSWRYPSARIQRVSAGTVFNILPVSVGETLDMLRTRQVTRSLFASGYFDDIRIARDDDVLIINLVERPAIESIEIEGNKAIKTDSLLEGLSEQGLSEGEIFRQATLERVSLELERQYVAQGRYGASIDTIIEELPRNRVSIKIEIEEGKSSGIRHINLVGAGF